MRFFCVVSTVSHYGGQAVNGGNVLICCAPGDFVRCGNSDLVKLNEQLDNRSVGVLMFKSELCTDTDTRKIILVLVFGVILEKKNQKNLEFSRSP